MAHYYRVKRKGNRFYADIHAMLIRSKVAHVDRADSPDTRVQQRTLELVLDECCDDDLRTEQGDNPGILDGVSGVDARDVVTFKKGIVIDEKF